jgi:hypothetical protein
LYEEFQNRPRPLRTFNLDYVEEVIYVYTLNEGFQPEDGRRKEFARITFSKEEIKWGRRV